MKTYGGYGWTGVDANLTASLLEYGILVCQFPERDYQDEYFVIYGIGNYESLGLKKFGTGYIRSTDISKLIAGQEWASKSDVAGFLSFCGQSRSEFTGSPMAIKLSSLIQYWGYENIMGTDYYPLNVKGLLRLSENLVKKYGQKYSLR